MKNGERGSNRRKFLRQSAALATAWLLPSLSSSDAAQTAIEKTIPSSGEQLPVIGMGTSRTFNAAGDAAAMAALTGVLEAFFAHGGSLVDSSPMYG